MSILAILLGLAVVGLVLWLVLTYIPMPEPYKRVVVVVVVVLVVLWLIRILGFSSSIAVPTT